MNPAESPPEEAPQADAPLPANRADRVCIWLVRGVALLGVVATVWAAFATGSMLVHGHPAYAILLALTFVVSVIVGLRAWRRGPGRHRRLKFVRGVLIVLSLIAIALCAWLVPSNAVEPALTAMNSDTAVTVTESADRIVMTPTGKTLDPAVFFQPGARVDARAYAEILRPLAAEGHLVVIAKQPLGIAFLSTGAFGAARAEFSSATSWVVAGHSLGGTVAAIDAAASSDVSADGNANVAPVVGLLLYASYPASDISSMDVQVLSFSASNDALATPSQIEASRADLPPGATFLVVEGGVHSFFGDYGAQAGDGTPSIGQDVAREEISAATLAFVRALTP